MADQPGLVSQVDPGLLSSIRYYRYTQLVSWVVATIVIYDYVVTFEREFELIWKKRWSVIKLAFIWHRYLGVLCVLFQVYALNAPEINDDFCRVWFFWETWGYCAALFTTEAVLLLWIYVLYNKNKWILTLISVCYVAEVISVISILTISFMNFQAQAAGIPGIHYCVMTDIGRPFQLLWVPILAYDALLLLLFLYRGCASACRRGNWRCASDYDGLFDMIYRHSLLNFLAIFASYLACAIIWLSSDIGLYQIPVSFALAFSITNCTRLLLNIRRAYYSGVSDPRLTNIRGMSPTGNNSPDPYITHDLLPSPGPPSLDINVPMTPLSASSKFSLFSSSTLREKTASPASTLRTTQVSTSPPSSMRVATGHRDDLERGEGGDKDGVLVQIVSAPPTPTSPFSPTPPTPPPKDRLEMDVDVARDKGNVLVDIGSRPASPAAPSSRSRASTTPPYARPDSCLSGVSSYVDVSLDGALELVRIGSPPLPTPSSPSSESQALSTPTTPTRRPDSGFSGVSSYVDVWEEARQFRASMPVPLSDEYMRAREVWLSRVDPDWWQAELRQMRVDPRVANGSGSRKGMRNGSVGL